jgi:uncharacterized protein
MNEQERQVISDIFQRLEQVAHEPRDPEAERFIQEKIRQQPYAPYAMAQAVYVQEQALQNLNAQLEALQAELEETRQRPQGGGFLSSLFGGGSREPERPRPAFGQPQQGGPWAQGGGFQAGAGPSGTGQGGPWAGSQPGMAPGMGQPGMPTQGGAFGAPQRGGSGFLGTALTTAAGVAGGMMLGNALSNAFGGSSGGAQGALGGALGGGTKANADGSNFSDLSPFGSGSGSGAGGSSDQDASFQDASFNGEEDFGGDLGDDIGSGDDWA